MAIQRIISFIFIFILLLVLIQAVKEAEWTDEAYETYRNYLRDSKRLFNHLFRENDYQKENSPVYTKQTENLSEQIVPRFHVDIILTFGRLMEMHAQEQQMYVLLEFLLSWRDLRLTWNVSDFDGISKIYVRQEELWIPENVPYDTQEIIDVHPDYIQTASVLSNGTIYMSHVLFVKTVCNMNLRTFPFDVQTCELKFSVYSYEMYEVSTWGRVSPNFDFKTFAGNGEFMVENISALVKSHAGSSSYETLEFHFVFKRYPHFYIYVIVLPCFILTFLSIVGIFWSENIKEEQLAKLSIGLTSLMSMTVLLDMVSQEIPKTTTFPLLGIYVIICVAIISVACVLLVTVPSKNKEKRDEKVKQTLWKKITHKLISGHFCLLLLFNAMNTVNFVVLMSFWD